MLTFAYLINEACGFVHTKLFKGEKPPELFLPAESGDGGTDRTESEVLHQKVEASLEEPQLTWAEIQYWTLKQQAIIRVDDMPLIVHKYTMALCSSYFRALFYSSWSSSEKLEYTIPGVSPGFMRMIMLYAYNKSICITEEIVEVLLVVADYLSVLDLVQECCRFLHAQLCPQNCIGILLVAEWYNCLDLQQSTKFYILHHFEEVVAESSELGMLSHHQLGEIIEKDDLNVKHEKTVLDAILHWISYDPQERNTHFGTLLPRVRMGLIKAQYFRHTLTNNAVVRGSEEVQTIFISALEKMYSVIKMVEFSSNYQHPMIRPRRPKTLLVAIGGLNNKSYTNTIEVYNSRVNRWVKMMETEVRERAYHGAVFLNGFVYWIGGADGEFNDRTKCLNSVRKFDPINQTWHKVASMHSRRCHVSVCVLGGYIYAMGGFDGRVHLKTAERYDPKSDQWTLISSMNIPRAEASATTLHGKVYICGGRTRKRHLSNAECYDPKTDRWSLIKQMGKVRSGLGVIAHRDQVYAVGGFNGFRCECSAEVYDPVNNTWRDFPNMIRRRSKFGIEVLDDQLFVVGGLDGIVETSSVEYYDEELNKWCEAKNMELSRSGLSCCVISNVHLMF